MPTPKEKYFFYSGVVVIEPVQTKIVAPEQQNAPKIRQHIPLGGTCCSKTNVFNPNDLRIGINIPPGHVANVIITFFKQIDKAQFDAFQPKPTDAEKKAGH